MNRGKSKKNKPADESAMTEPSAAQSAPASTAPAQVKSAEQKPKSRAKRQKPESESGLRSSNPTTSENTTSDAQLASGADSMQKEKVTKKSVSRRVSARPKVLPQDVVSDSAPSRVNIPAVNIPVLEPEENAAYESSIRELIQDAIAGEYKLRIVGGGSKSWYATQNTIGQNIVEIDSKLHRGVIDYQPSELYLQARAGTPLKEVMEVLDQANQMLAFEPPLFTDDATVGGMLACGIAGPRRAYAGSMRDHVLGVTLMNGRGERLRFGSKVIKNVAGFDVARCMVGSRASLGLLLDVTLKVIPKPSAEWSLIFAMDEAEALQAMHAWAMQALPISASCFHAGRLSVRLSGYEEVLRAAHAQMGGQRCELDRAFWRSVREQTHHFFAPDPELVLWRLSLPSTAPAPAFRHKSLIEWGGAQRWIWTLEPTEVVRDYAAACGGHASMFRYATEPAQVFTPLAPLQAALQERLRKVFDPHGVFDVGQLIR